MRQAYYSNTLSNFLSDSADAIVGQLNLGITDYKYIWTRTTASWSTSIQIFKDNFSELIKEYGSAKNWTLLLEYEIPRLLRRIDAVLIADDIIFVIEYKDDRKEYRVADKRQAEDYAMDLQDFHLGSRGKTIVPILLSPDAIDAKQEFSASSQFVKPTIFANKHNLFKTIYYAYTNFHDESASPINVNEWGNSGYSPTPTIIQAAQALFAGHKVEDISNSGAINLAETTEYISNAIEDAKTNKKKIVCFVTGVPGAGKTLVGLNLIHKENFNEENQTSAAYFSGNGPLIKVLREALTRDDVQRQKKTLSDSKEKHTKKQSEKKIESKIQNLHKFIKDGLRKNAPPFERIVVFDEAQRCWNAEHFYNQIKRNQNRQEENKRFDPVLKSEAEILFEIMDYHDWAVIVALVGNGQEINTGEAGIREWGNTIKNRFKHWEVYISPELLVESPNSLFIGKYDDIKINANRSMHLSVSQRTFKAAQLNEWVNLVIDNKPQEAANLLYSIHLKYPIYLTRSLTVAKNWLRNRKLGNKKVGLLTSSGALRLRPYGIVTKSDVNEVTWFLAEEDNIGASDFLEIAATEFSVQGLEIDWAGLCWDADLRRINNEWQVRHFSGSKWQNTKDYDFIINTYRVLLTRAREGMIIWVPEGDKTDATRLPEFYDPIYEYLKSCGVPEL